MPSERLVARFSFFFLLLLMHGGCSEAILEIRLATLPDDNPYDGMREVELLSRTNGDTLERQRRSFDGGPIELEALAREPGMVVTVNGFDDSGDVISTGRAEPRMPERGAACCVTLCFCSSSRHDDGECTCGSDECDSCYQSL